MTNDLIAVYVPADCVWALQQISASTGESPQTILRAAVGDAWSKFAAKERLYREAALSNVSATPHENIVELESCRRREFP